MKILILGTGAIGATYGWAFSEAGHDVTHLVKPGRQERFKSGIHLDIFDERKGHKKNTITTYTLKCVEAIDPSEHYELIILPLHFYQIETALQALVPVSGDALFLVFGSNWHGTELIDTYLPRERYLLGFPYGGGTTQNGKHVVYLGTKVYLGEVDGNPSEKLEQMKSLFARADLRTDVPDNILHLIWTCHSTAVGLAAGIAQSREVKSFLRDKSSMEQGYRVVRELFELCRLRGCEPNKYPDQAFLFNVPVWLFILIFRLFSAYNAGIPRVLGRLAKPAGDTAELYKAMMKTAQDLRFNMPNARAVATRLQAP